jgi:hypothetical protein
VLDAVVALGAEEGAAQEARSAEEHVKLEVARAEAEKLLHERLLAVDHALEALVETLQPALAVSDDYYNAGLPLGVRSGASTSTRDRIEARINHRLRLAGLPDFEMSLSR